MDDDNVDRPAADGTVQREALGRSLADLRALHERSRTTNAGLADEIGKARSLLATSAELVGRLGR